MTRCRAALLFAGSLAMVAVAFAALGRALAYQSAEELYGE